MSLLIDLVSYWSFQSLQTDSTGYNGLTNTNGVTQATGLIGQAASFSHVSQQYLSVGSNYSQNPPYLASFTIDGWLMPTTVTVGSRGVFHNSQSDLNNQGYLLVISGGTLQFYTFNSGIIAAVSASITANAWNYFRAWYDNAAGTLNLQINNGGINSTSASGPPASSIYSLIFGTMDTGNPTEYYDGLMDEFGFWNRVLLTSEAAARYNSGAGNTYPFSDMGPEIITGSGTFTFSAQSNVLVAECIAGGGGSDSGGVSLGGEGGGGGAYSKKIITDLTIGFTYYGQVGAAGIVGGAGGDSWFSTSGTVLAKGGQPGVATGGSGGAAGSGVGDIKFSGGDGGTANTTGGAGGGSSASAAGAGTNGVAGGIGTGGAGGTAPTGGGNGGNGGNATAAGNSGTAPGGGGGAGGTGGGGAVGAAGQVVLTWSLAPEWLLNRMTYEEVEELISY